MHVRMYVSVVLERNVLIVTRFRREGREEERKGEEGKESWYWNILDESYIPAINILAAALLSLPS